MLTLLDLSWLIAPQKAASGRILGQRLHTLTGDWRLGADWILKNVMLTIMQCAMSRTAYTLVSFRKPADTVSTSIQALPYINPNP